jgi:GNAT superfamily N-acetyltransferase
MTHTEASSTPFRIRPAERRDVPQLVELIAGLAKYERLEHQLEVTPAKLEPQLFGAKPAAEAIVAEHTAGDLLGFALFFTTFSTFLAKPGLWLEDLFVLPAQRRHGIGRALLRALAQLVLERGYGRLEWSVLDWNAPALRFYQEIGASVMPDWRICRMTGPSIERLGG